MNIELSVERRAAVHAALGDPVRLAVVDALALGDAAPSDLAHRLGVRSNLLAHHLNVLVDAGVVRRARSEGDRRRTYVMLDPETAAAMPSLVTASIATVPRVTFVCSQNSARSQLAAALWRRASEVPVASAGTRPAAKVHTGAVAAARRRGLSLRGARPAAVVDVVRPRDLVVAVCDEAHEALDDLPRLHWSVPDPVRVGTSAAFDDALSEIDERIGRLAGAVAQA